MRTDSLDGAHGAPYGFMDKSGRTNMPRLKACFPAALMRNLSSLYNPRALPTPGRSDRIPETKMLIEASSLFIFQIA